MLWGCVLWLFPMHALNPARRDILSLLQGRDRRTIGRSDKVAAILSRNPELFPQLIAGLWAVDPLVRMRAADAVEKVTRQHCELPALQERTTGFDEGEHATGAVLASRGHGSEAVAEREGKEL